MNRQTYFVMRKNSTGIQSSVWIFPLTGTTFCGVCLRGEVDSQLGSRCTLCDSEVVREFTAISAIAVGRAERRKREAQYGDRVARSGNVLIMQAG
jgi:hypothetical protein